MWSHRGSVCCKQTQQVTTLLSPTMLGVVGICSVVHANEHNTCQRCWRKVVILALKAHANGRNKSQHCCLLLGFFGQQCCVRLHRPKSLTGFKLYATSANIVVVPCKRTQNVGPNNVVCCWPTMLRPFLSLAFPLSVYRPSHVFPQIIVFILFSLIN